MYVSCSASYEISQHQAHLQAGLAGLDLGPAAAQGAIADAVHASLQLQGPLLAPVTAEDHLLGPQVAHNQVEAVVLLVTNSV